MEKLIISASSGIDWLSCTVSIQHFELMKEKLRFFDLVEEGDFVFIKAFHGYKKAVKLLGGRFQWGFKHQDAFIHFDLSGSGCQLLGGRIWELLVFLKSARAKFTRIDLAFDFINTESLMTNVRKDLVCQSFSGFQSWQEITTTNNDVKATTFYLGSRSSPRFARIYDKGLESGQYKEEGKLIRFEFVFRSDQCQVVASLLLNNASIVSEVAGLTFNLYRFGNVKRISANKREWVSSFWYQKILDSFGKLKLRDLPAMPKNINFEKYCLWLVEQVFPQLKLTGLACGLTPGEVLDIIFSYHKVSVEHLMKKRDVHTQAFNKLRREKKEIFK